MPGFLKRDALQPLLAKFLHVRRTELGRTLQVAVFAIVIGCAMYTAFNATQAIFLAKAGPQAYPLFFIILAFAVWPMVALQGALTRRLGVARAFRVNLALNSVLALGIYVAYTLGETPTVAFAAYVIYSVAFELVMLHFWTFVSQHFNLLEGKRIFPVIAAGSSIGYILAGVITTLVAVFATEPLMLVWAFGAGLASVMSVGLERTLFRPALHDDADDFFADEEVVRRKHGAMEALQAAIRYLTGRRLVLALVLLALVLQVASRIGDYLVAVVFVAAAHHNVQALTILIGNAWLASYVVQLVVSLFVTPWVFDKLGVKNAILGLPVFTLIGFTAVALSPLLATSLFLFIVRNGLQTGLDDPAESVLGGALPAQVGPKLKFLLDNVVLPGAAVLSGAGLFLVQRAGASVRTLAVIGILTSLFFILAATQVRSLYVRAIYERLRTHTLTLSDFQRAIGRPSEQQIEELQGDIRHGDESVRQFAAAALGTRAPEAFADMLPELVTSEDSRVRRLGFQMAPPETITEEQLVAAKDDEDGWVQAAVAVAGAKRTPPWEPSAGLLHRLWQSPDSTKRAAAVWAAAFVAGHETVVEGLRDRDPRVRLEAIRSFAKLKGDVPNVSGALIACMRDEAVDVRREALQQAVRWAPPADDDSGFSDALVDGLASGDRDVRRLAAEAMAVQSPAALERTVPLLSARDETAVAAVEALIRGGRRDLFDRTKAHLELLMNDAIKMARVSARVAGASRGRSGDDGGRDAFLRLALDDYINHAADSGLAAMRALHGKRGFATVERGLRSGEPQARAEGQETLLNFGPGWLAGPLARLLDPESFDLGPARGLSQAELEVLENHTDKWIKEAAEAASGGSGEHMKELIALKRVPLFSTLSLEQLASIDRLMVTRHYVKGETVFTKGDVGAELFVVLEGEIRIHLDRDGREMTLARHGPSEVLGEMAAFDDQPRSASAQATMDTTVRVLRRDRLHAIVHEHPEVLMEFIKNLTQRLRVMNEQLQDGKGVAETELAGGATTTA